MAFLYNPDRMTEQEVKDTFVARTSLVDTLLQLIERQPNGAGVQHAVITGPRGMGKTTILLMVQYRIAEAELSQKWQPIKFPEESYSISDLADLWIEALNLLAAATEDSNLESEIKSLQDKQSSVNDLGEQAWAMIKDWSTIHKKRLVFLIDNFDMIIEQIGDDREKSRLRDILMNDGTVMFIGTAVSFFKESNYDKPFYHFFRLFDLKGLIHEDVVVLLKRRAAIDGIKNFETILAESRGRFLALEYFTAGNPRLILMLYRVVTEWGSAEVRKSLEKLLDEVTPYYKSKTEILPAQQRKILDHIARESAKSFEGLSPSDIASATRMKPNIVSMQLKRLAEAGYVRSANIKGRSSCFTLSEPLYAIWYQMRFSRTAKERMMWLVSFLKIWFELPQLLDEVKSVRNKVEDCCKVKEMGKAYGILEHGKYLLEAMPDGPEKKLATNEYLKSQMIAEDWVHIKETIGNADLSTLTDDELMVLNQRKSIDQGNYLNEKAWRVYNAGRFDEAHKLLDEFIQIRPDIPELWYDLGITLHKLGRFKEAVKAYDKALLMKQDLYEAWSSRGEALVVLEQFNEAVESFDKALHLKSIESNVWYNRGTALMNLRQFKAAIKSYDKALQIQHSDYQAWNDKGVVLSILGKYQESLQAYNRATSFTDDIIPWKNQADASLILTIKAFLEGNLDQALQYFNESRKSEPIIGQERWMSIIMNRLLSFGILVGNLPYIRNFIAYAGLDQELFPLVRAIDYLQTGNEELIEKLSPEYRKIVTEVAKTLKKRKSGGKPVSGSM
jgi:uncharacterized protein